MENVRSQEHQTSKPLQIGETSSEVARIIDELSSTGVATEGQAEQATEPPSKIGSDDKRDLSDKLRHGDRDLTMPTAINPG